MSEHTKNKIVQLPCEDCAADTNVTFVIADEGHTLGNALKSIISQYHDVQMCGYTIPHMLDNAINLKIQTNGAVKALDVLKRGLDDLNFLCDQVLTESELAMK